MSDTKVQPTHLRRTAFVYVRQSSAAQVKHHRESGIVPFVVELRE